MDHTTQHKSRPEPEYPGRGRKSKMQGKLALQIRFLSHNEKDFKEDEK